MTNEQLRTTFNRQAAGYDAQWQRLAPIREALYLVVEAAFAELPDDARILCVGAGTGAEIAWMAGRFPGWTFTAVEPSGAMLDLCRLRAEEEAFIGRCSFHEGYLDSLPPGADYHAATCFLVSQFILDREDRSSFFRSIADRLLPGGILASADLSSGTDPNSFDELIRIWMTIMMGARVPEERLEQAREAYSKDVAVLPPETVGAIINAGGFEVPVQVLRVGLMCGWVARRE